MKKSFHYKFTLVILLFFICAILKSQEFSKKIELPEIELAAKDVSEENFMIFKSTWKDLGTFKNHYEGVFKGEYLKNNVYLEPITGEVDINYDKKEIIIKSINDKEYLSLFRKVIPTTIGFSLFPYEVITNNPNNISFRCIKKGDKTWGFRILNNEKERYNIKGIEYIFIVKLNEMGNLKEIQIAYEHSKNELNYHLTTSYGIDEGGTIIIKKIYAELQNPSTKNILKLELNLEN